MSIKLHQRTFWFNTMIFLLLILVGGIIFRGYRLLITNDFLFKEAINVDGLEMPTWYPYATIGLGILSLLGVILIYFFKKVGVYLLPLALFLSVLMQPIFMPDGTLYSLFTLFVFVGFGLSIIITHWKSFK